MDALNSSILLKSRGRPGRRFIAVVSERYKRSPTNKTSASHFKDSDEQYRNREDARNHPLNQDSSGWRSEER